MNSKLNGHRNTVMQIF